MDPQRRAEIVSSFRQQALSSDVLGSQFTAQLLTAAAADLERGGPVVDLVSAWEGDPVAGALPLRFAGALHWLALAEPGSELARHYPPHAWRGDDPVLWGLVRETAVSRRDVFARYLERPPQTNEVRRSTVLMGGFIEVGRTGGLPLSLLEIGASAGLNLIAEAYYDVVGDATWGDPRSPVVLTPRSTGIPPLLDRPLEVLARAACDAAPIDLTDDQAAARLLSYIWPDQRDRVALHEAAIDLARRRKVRVIAADAGDFLAERLAARPAGAATVIYHSVVWRYLSAETKRAVTRAIGTAARQARPDSPLAWLRFEPGQDGKYYLDLTCWPEETHRRLAEASPHGAWVSWFDAAVPPAAGDSKAFSV